jgi:hypothetical protein
VRPAVTYFKQLILWLVIGAVVVCLAGHCLHRFETVQAQGEIVGAQTDTVQMPITPYRISESERKELAAMRLNLNYGAKLAWRAALIRAMLEKANWLANRLNLPIRRPIYTTDVQSWQVMPPFSLALNTGPPSWLPDTVFGTHIYDTNFSRLQRILALKFGLDGKLDTPPFEFSFSDGQFWDIVRIDPSESGRYADRFAARINETTPSSDAAAQAYHLATNWLAAVDVNLAMLEKARLPHPVHQGEYQSGGALIPQPVYFVDWGTNYYGLYHAYKTWHTNEWHPAVTVEISTNNELLELYVGDPNFFRNSPMLIPSETVWRLVHTPDPSFRQLQTLAGMQAFVMTPEEVSNYIKSFDYMTNSTTWKYQHHLLDAHMTTYYSNYMKNLNSELIPYTNCP